MEKAAPFEIDLEDWELLLPEDHLLLRGKSFVPKNETFFDPKGIVDVNYFICPSSPSSFLLEEKKGPAEEFNDIGVVVPPPPPLLAAERDAISQVFFKKFNDNEFADMKLGSPKSNTKAVAPIPFDDKEEDLKHELEKNSVYEKEDSAPEIKEKACWENFGFSVWRWRLNGVGALCSIGVAAATLCVFILSGRREHKHCYQGPKIQLEIYADDKRMKEVVQQATRLNQALRGAPAITNRAQVSFGGYYDGL